jgi:hypothetical protein
MREWLKLVEKLASRVFFPKPPQSNFSVRFAGIDAGCLLRCGAGRQVANPVMLIVL